ncbi:hypothetical protein VF21_09555 [Pseudogymnoascus sp. 05NY08]|nr:hypothetical protein VF21_09555 [Pseudogymnoascus sp. 05NY08]
MAPAVDFTLNLKPRSPGGPETIAKERACSEIIVPELSQHLLGHEFLERQQRVLSFLENDKIFSKTSQMNLSRPDRYKLGLARGKRLRQLVKKHSWSEDDYELAKYLVDDSSPYTLHTTMFLNCLMEQTSDAQREYWMPRHNRWEITGAYAQTEMGHGSNVKGIELEAKWDPETKEFILHSPSLTSSKWWPGSLGRTANHSIVVAQLLLPVPGEPGRAVEYKNYGPHPFILQIRDMKTHRPLDGIVVGDIGPKYGYAPMDNGYMLFDHHRIPHSAMLSRYSRVDRDTSEYTKPENPAVVYGSLTNARARIVMHARLVLARAVTVAVRYTSIRRQFKDKDSTRSSGLEVPVLDYSTVQIRILPLLASVFALHYSGQKMKEVYISTRQGVEQGDFSGLVELHSMSSGLKSLCTDIAAAGIETCRRAMGGHGYGGYSGLVQLNADYLSKPTVEGDNWMITQQVGRYLIKSAKKIVDQPSKAAETRTESILQRYWKSKGTGVNLDFLNDDRAIVDAFEHRAAYSSFNLYQLREVQKLPWNDVLIEMYKLSQAHSRTILVYNFYIALIAIEEEKTLDSKTRNVLWDLFRLFALTNIEDDGLAFMRSGAMTQQQLNAIPRRVLGLMRYIRPHAVRLVDSWAIPDYLLDSSLGRSDGNVYEDMFNRAHRLNPVNQITFNPDYRTDEIVHGSGDGGEILAKL